MLSATSTTRTVAIVCLLALGAPALAETSQESDAGAKSSGSYWSTVFQGGVLVPLRTMAEGYQYSLAAGGRIGWTSRFGLGMDVAAEYSPLARLRDPGADAFETHFVTTALMPRFTLGKGVLRVWVSGGAGLAYQRQERLVGMAVEDAVSSYAMAGVTAAGLELHLLTGAALVAVGSYTRTYYGDFTYELANVTGGFAFTFR